MTGVYSYLSLSKSSFLVYFAAESNSILPLLAITRVSNFSIVAVAKNPMR